MWGARRHLEIHGDALDQLDASPGQEASQEQLVEPFGIGAVAA
jgi:hypothetical protein